MFKETTAQSMRRKELLMELKIFTIRDSKGEIYHPPFYTKTHGEAERTFRELAKDPNSMIAKYPEDYDMYFLGIYDNSEGKIAAHETPQHVIKAVNLITA